ncbi:hypothetical protein G4D82_10905 [Flavobacterium sp. CYK-4]|uniref:tetratricopeptide repeat protein n=1 Tax=Flavobacterium lotistagni TaxID=2709660 RepID=UPI001408897C|nr:hypothetical protein [Flavobacterium lotistagni]NHM07733.1 hypothetical protein [Flavobacterium lotistagni]
MPLLKNRLRYSIVSFLLVFQCVFAQTDGYWDKDRATSRQVTVSAGERIVIPVETLPEGTTEIVYRITLLDENQQLSNSLVSILKAIPDPTGISQGSAGAVFLLSKISGDDKCKYAIFNNKELALDYKKEGNVEKACLYQNNPINKDAKRLSVKTSTCLKNSQMWFGFESKNWIMNQRIVLEVVPWIDVKLSRGWSVENRKEILRICKSTDLAKKLPEAQSDDYCVCVLDKIQNQYKFNEYQSLLAAEKTKAFKDGGLACYNETHASATIYDNHRAAAVAFFADGKYGQAIGKLLPIVEEKKAKVSDYDLLGLNYLYTKQYDKALKYLEIGQQLDATELSLQLHLAHAHLLKGNFGAAKSIYKKYQNQNISDSMSWKDQVKTDFTSFEKAGLPNTNFDRILNLLK